MKNDRSIVVFNMINTYAELFCSNATNDDLIRHYETFPACICWDAEQICSNRRVGLG